MRKGKKKMINNGLPREGDARDNGGRKSWESEKVSAVYTARNREVLVPTF